MAALKGMSTAEVKEKLPTWMEKLQVKGKLTDKIKSLSKGNQQKVQDVYKRQQLYLSEKKLQAIQMLDQSADIINVDPISVLAFGNRFLITDGHHRAYQALLAGRDTITAEFDRDGGDELYALYAKACEERKITSVLDLKHRILSLIHI